MGLGHSFGRGFTYSLVEGQNDQRELLEWSSPKSDPNSVEPMKSKISIEIVGMTCSNCSGTIEKGIRELKGVDHISVSLMINRAEVLFRPNEITADAVVEEIEDLGFEAKLRPSVPENDLSCTGIIMQGKLTDDMNAEIKKLMLLKGVLFTQGTEFSFKRGKKGQSHIHQGKDLPQGLLMVSQKSFDKHSYEEIDSSEQQHLLPDDLLRVVVHFDPVETGIRDIAKEVIKISKLSGGDEVVWIETGESLQAQQKRDKQNKENELAKWRQQFWLAALLTVPVFIIGVISQNISVLWKLLQSKVFEKFSLTWQALLLLILATPVQFGPGKRFLVAAVKSIRHGAASMDVLIALGSSVAYSYSIFSIIMAFACGTTWHCTVFFDTSAMLITVVLLGRLMEHTTKGRTSEALTKLMTLQPKTALLCRFPESTTCAKKNKSGRLTLRTLAEAKTEPIPVHLIQKGDILLVKRGSSVPVDGVVIHGETGVDQGMVTGESMPVYKSVGDNVIGGTQNVEGNIYIKATVTRPGDTILAQIVNMVQEAQSKKPPIQKAADSIAAVFVPTVIGVSLVTFFVWLLVLHAGKVSLPVEMTENGADSNFLFALMRAVAVLVISCPCSLGLATPTAIMVATGVGAEKGILYKSGAALEAAGTSTAVVFDKTGTLTEARPEVVKVKLFLSSHEGDGKDRKSVNSEQACQLWKRVAAIESLSEHVLANAIRKYADLKAKKGYAIRSSEKKSSSNMPAVENFVAKTGAGVSGIVDGVKISIGSERWMKMSGIQCTTSALEVTSKLQEQGYVTVYVASGGKIDAVLGIVDKIKPEAAALIRWLNEQRIEVHMCTGDSEKSAIYTAREVGIPAQSVRANALPSDKTELIQELQDRGQRVLFIGDGINDAPALAQADVGATVSKGTDIAIESADIVLVNRDNGLLDLATAIDLSRSTLKQIRINYIWALFYNIIGIPIAAGVLYPKFHFLLPPVAAAIAMGCSSTSVVLSSLSLKRYVAPEVTLKLTRDITRGAGQNDFRITIDTYRGDSYDLKLVGGDMSAHSGLSDEGSHVSEMSDLQY